MVTPPHLHTSLGDLVTAKAPLINLFDPSHTAECSGEASAEPQEETPCPGIACAITTVTSWAFKIQQHTTSNIPPVPHQHLLLLVTALSAPPEDSHLAGSSSHCDTAAALSASFKPLTQAALQLCSSAEASAAAVSGMLQDAAHTPTSTQHSQHQQHTATAIAEARQQFSSLLLWSCHLTAALHKFTCHAHLTSTATTSSSRRTKPAAAAAAVAVPHTGYTLPAQQQQHWVNKTLPLALQHILACYCQLTGSTDSSGSSGSSSSSNPSAGASSSLGCTREHGSSCPSPAGATSSDNRGWKAASLGGISSCMLLPSPKQQSAADQLLYGTCLTILTSDSSSSSTNPASKKGGKPPAKQARKATNSSSSNSSSLTQDSLDLLASMLGCHLSFRHQQQLQQLTKQHKKPLASSSSSSNGDGWCWCEEAARVLADPQQGHLQLLLPQALVSLLHRPSSRAAACNMLCAAAETICMPGNPAAAAGKAGRQQQAGAAAAVNSQSSGLLLQLLSDVLVTHWPHEWQRCALEDVSTAAAPTPAPTAAAGAAAELDATAGKQSQPQQQQQQQRKEDSAGASATTAAAATAYMQPDAVRQLLGTSLLPSLQPVATCATNAAWRKLFLSIAAVAAVPPRMAAPQQHRSSSSRATAAALTGPAHSSPAAAAAVAAAAAAAACQGQVAGLLALSEAAQSDRDATVRSKALALLQQAVPSFLQAWQGWNQLSALQQQQHQQQHQAAGSSGQVQEEAVAGSSGQQQQQKQQAVAAETTDEQQHQQDKESARCAVQQGGSLDSCHAASSPAALQPQPTAVLAAAATAMPAATPTAPTAEACAAEAVAGLRNAAAAAATALISQLLGSSKASRLKALQVLLQLVHPLPSPTRRASFSSSAAAAAAGTASVLQLQQQLVCITFPSICSILAAGQDSALYCQSCKAVAEELLPAMAAVLQPQQALQLALYHSCTYSSSENHAWQQQQQQQQQEEVDSNRRPEALLLASLAKCSAVQLYKLLKQQIQQAAPAALHTPSASEGAAAEPRGSSSSSSSSSGGSSHTAPVRQGVTRLLLLQLRRLVGGVPGREAVRRHAFMQACQALSRAAAAAADDRGGFDVNPSTAAAEASGGSDCGLGGSQAAAAETDSEGSLQQQQQALLQAMQLLQVCGGCQTRDAHDLRAELAILTDALDLCCMWLQQSSQAAPLVQQATADADPAAAAAAVDVPGSDAAGASSRSSNGSRSTIAADICRELLWSILCILDSAHTAAAAGMASNQISTAADAPAAAAAGGGGSVWCGQWMWGEVGACLMHHLNLVVPDSSSTAAAAAAAAVQLPVSTLDLYLKVLCGASHQQQLLLHDLLCTWHKQLAAQQPAPAAPAAAAAADVDTAAQVEQQESPLTADTTAAEDPAAAAAAAAAPTAAEQEVQGAPAAAAAAAAAPNSRLVAFLLLVKHLSGLYAPEQERFRQRVAHAMKAASTAAAAAAVDSPAPLPAAAAAAADVGGDVSQQQSAGKPQQQQQQQRFDYMLDEEEAACVEASAAQFTADLLAETAPACYLPLLLQLVGAEAAPAHVRVLALQALEPLLLVSADLSKRHSTSLAALLLPRTTGLQPPPAALLLAAVGTSGRLITARPAESSVLVQHLEELMLCALAENLSEGQLAGAEVPAAVAAAAAAAVPAAVAAARWYSQLLLSEKLLLTGRSWGLVAAGLLAKGPMLVVAGIMQQLVGSLINQQRMPQCQVALDLLLNHNPKPQRAHISASSASATAAAAGAGSSLSQQQQQQQMVRRSEPDALVQQLLSHVLTPKELASESLTLPLLQAVTLAAGSGWGSSSSSKDGMVGGGVGADGGGQASAAAAAALLAACIPSGRCLEVLLRTCQAHKHSMFLHCSGRTLSHLITCVHNFSSSSSKVGQAGSKAAAGAAEGSSKGSAASAQHASMQQQLLRLLTGMGAAAAAAVPSPPPALRDVLEAVADTDKEQVAIEAAGTAIAGEAGVAGQGNLARSGTAAGAAAGGAVRPTRASAAAAAAATIAGQSRAVGAQQVPSRPRRYAGGKASDAPLAARTGAATAGATTAMVQIGSAAGGGGVQLGVKRSRVAARLPVGSKGGSAGDAEALQALLRERQKDVMQLQQMT